MLADSNPTALLDPRGPILLANQGAGKARRTAKGTTRPHSTANNKMITRSHATETRTIRRITPTKRFPQVISLRAMRLVPLFIFTWEWTCSQANRGQHKFSLPPPQNNSTWFKKGPSGTHSY